MRSVLPAVVVVVLLAGCGSSGGGHDAPQPAQPAARTPAPDPEQDPTALPADVPRAASGKAPADARTAVDGWLAAVRNGDFPKAATYFAVPARVQNVSPVIELSTRRVIAG